MKDQVQYAIINKLDFLTAVSRLTHHLKPIPKLWFQFPFQRSNNILFHASHRQATYVLHSYYIQMYFTAFITSDSQAPVLCKF